VRPRGDPHRPLEARDAHRDGDREPRRQAVAAPRGLADGIAPSAAAAARTSQTRCPTSRQGLELENGWRAIFYLDSPLGRDLVLGQQLVFEVEVEQPETKTVDRLQLPLVATNTAQPGTRR